MSNTSMTTALKQIQQQSKFYADFMAALSVASLTKGDYVLATKYDDGDPCDPYAVGFYDKEFRGRHQVVDALGNSFRNNGFRRVQKITAAEGQYILNEVKGDVPGISIWSHLEQYRYRVLAEETSSPDPFDGVNVDDWIDDDTSEEIPDEQYEEVEDDYNAYYQ